MNLEKTCNYEHYTLNAATSCADGVKIKQHTPCVASRIVRLLATCPASGQENARFERKVDLPSNTRQQPSHIEARSTAAEVLKSKDTDLSSSEGEGATLQSSTANVEDETDAVFRLYAGAKAGDVANLRAQHRRHLRCLIPVVSLGCFNFVDVPRMPDDLRLWQHEVQNRKRWISQVSNQFPEVCCAVARGRDDPTSAA